MLTLPPVKGEISLAGVFPFAGVGGSARTRVIVVVVVVVVVFPPLYFRRLHRVFNKDFWNIH